MTTQNRIENSEKSPRISVYILAYNRAKLLPRAVNSVLNQTFLDFELVIVNNGSTDNTEEVLRSFEDKRIIYRKHEENKGLLGGLNTALDTVRGKYIINLSDDDEFLPDALETIDKKFSELAPRGIKILWFDCIDAESGKYSGFGLKKEEGYISYKDYLCNKIIGDYQFAIDREVIGVKRYNSELWGGMPSIMLLDLYRDNRAFYIPKIICKLYREHGESRISSPETSLINHIPKIILTMKEFLKKYGDETKKLCPKCYGQRLASLGFYQILNGEKKDGRSNILEALKFSFSLYHLFIFLFSLILSKETINFICLSFFKMKRLISVKINIFRKLAKLNI